jgi:hypothetical protein
MVKKFLTMRHVPEIGGTIGPRKVRNIVPDGQPRQHLGFPRMLEGLKKPPEVSWPSRDALEPLSSRYCCSEGFFVMKKIDIAAVPELRTSVGIHGSLKQKEVAGPICLGVLAAIVMAL